MNPFVLVLKKNDDLVKSLIDYCATNNIKSAWISAIGALSSVRLALYDLDQKNYIFKDISGPLEIASMAGNVAVLDNKLVHHLHIVVSDQTMSAFAGHLDSAIIAATCEIFIHPLEQTIIRHHNDEIGLNLISE